MESAKAEGEKIRLIGAADARAVEAVGRWAVGKYCCNEPSRSFTVTGEGTLMIFCCSGRRLSGCE